MDLTGLMPYFKIQYPETLCWSSKRLDRVLSLAVYLQAKGKVG